MAANGAIAERTPLSVLLFHAAMSKDKSVSDYAGELKIGAISLRQFIEGNTQRPRQKTLEQIAENLGLPVDDVRRRMGIAPEASVSFGDWLEANMKRAGFSRAKLTRETKISDGALRNYLADRTMPDANQAQQLARVLGADPLDVARVIVASTVAQNGGTVAQPEDAEAPAEAEAPADSGELDMASAGAPATPGTPDEASLLGLWRQLHPQARRATFSYIAMLLAER